MTIATIRNCFQAGWSALLMPLFLLAGLSACGNSSTSSPSAARAPIPAEADAGTWKTAGRWTIDGLGRVRIYHGVNIIRKFEPYFENRFTEQDAQFLASEGFNVARIGFIWEAVEPQPGVYDDAYISKIVELDRLLQKYGIRTIVDFHQDAWSRAFTGDGAPAWATLPDSPLTPYTFVIGINNAFAHFWRDEPAADGVGVQTHFINAWRHVVPFLKESRNIIAYDFFNEPYPGADYGNPTGFVGDCGYFAACPAFEQGALSDFNQRIVTAVRMIDPDRQVMIEDVAGNHEILLTPIMSSNVALGYHVYCNPIPIGLFPELNNVVSDAQCPQTEAINLDYGLMYSTNNSFSPFVGEFSASDANSDNARMVDLMGTRFLPWAIWQYYNGPKVAIETLQLEGLVSDDNMPGSQHNSRQGKLDAIVVPYPVAVAGTPLTYSFDRTSGVMTFTYSTKSAGPASSPDATTEIFIPHRKFPTGYTATVSGGRAVSSPTAAYLMLAADKDASQVSVTVAPISGSSTDIPYF